MAIRFLILACLCLTMASPTAAQHLEPEPDSVLPKDPRSDAPPVSGSVRRQATPSQSKVLLSAGPTLGTTGLGLQGGLLIGRPDRRSLFGFHALGSRGLFADTLPSSIAAFHLVAARALPSSSGPLTIVLMGGIGGATASKKGPLVRTDTTTYAWINGLIEVTSTRPIYRKTTQSSPSALVGVQIGSAFPKGSGLSFFTGVVACAQPTVLLSLQVHRADF